MTEQTTENLDPQTFDIDDWLVDAKLPEESVDVYKRPDVISELSELKRRIEEHQDADDGERAAGETSERAKLERKYTDLLNTFGNSRLTIYISAIPKELMRDLRIAHDARVASGEIPGDTDGHEFGWLILSESIVGVKTGDGERRGVHWSVDQVKKLAKKIGDPQMLGLTQAQRQAQNAVPEVDADFLPRASGTSKESAED